MIDPDNVGPVSNDEELARYILYSKHIRNDGSVRPAAFTPIPHTAMSTTRHLHASEQEIWNAGRTVAAARQRTLYGRADVSAGVCVAKGLEVEAAPLPNNPNHADVKSWPPGKPEQIEVAQDLAERARCLSAP